jgi:hypothetical protein
MAESNFPPATRGDFFCPFGGTWYFSPTDSVKHYVAEAVPQLSQHYVSNMFRYACQNGTRFIGCCATDPCVAGCFGNNLRPAGMSARVYSLSPGGTCGGSTQFWTCLAGPSFWGCCNSNPCGNNATCPTGNLEPALMDRSAQIEYFGALNVLLSSTIPSATSSPSVSASISPPPSNFNSSSASGAVIGGAIGGAVAFLASVGAIVFFLCYRKKREHKSTANETSDHANTAISRDKSAHIHSPHFSDNSRW